MSSLLPDADLTPTRRLDGPKVPSCGACRLNETCLSPVMKPYGRGRRGVLVVGGSPGDKDDQQGKPFMGKAGQCLRDELSAISVDLDEDCWSTNSIACRPPHDAMPTDRQVAHCRPLVERAIAEYRPNVILLLGVSAIQSVIGMAWGKAGSKETKVGPVERWCGWQIPCQVPNAWICPTYCPLKIMEYREKARDVCMESLVWRKHLEACFSITSCPWDQLPDFPGRCKSVMDEREAVARVRAMIGDRPVSFDFETNMLKPDSPRSEIICCSVCDGDLSIAFPWTEMTKQAVGEFLRSNTPKWGYNAKFEERWVLRHFGHGVNNWQHDGMLAAHVLDNRPSTKSLKFQAFVRLGAASYDEEIKGYFEAATGNTPSRIRDLTRSDGGWRKLARYCSLDSLYEWEIANMQIEELTNGNRPRSTP